MFFQTSYNKPASYIELTQRIEYQLRVMQNIDYLCGLEKAKTYEVPN